MMDINSTDNQYRVDYCSNIKFNNQRRVVPFGYVGLKDTFQNNSPYTYFDERKIRKMIEDNPEINRILSENNIPLHLNLKELEELKTGHCQDTQNIAVAIAKNLPVSLKQQVDFAKLKEGALLHDFGKVLIPLCVLNKNSSLTPDEHKIMDLHSELGYQLLKTKDIDEEVLNYVRYHHKPYENVDGKKVFVPDINLQIINLADKYSALTEKRVYKEAFPPQKALAILSNDVKLGELHPFLFNTLVKAVQYER